MESCEIRVENNVERLLVEQALSMARELKEACRTAPDGQALDRAEQVALARGRELTRNALELTLNAEAEEVEKQNAPGRTCECGGPRRHRGSRPRNVLTAAGILKLRRVYFTCCTCGEGGYPQDVRLGIDAYASRQARRLICLAGASWSFDCSSNHLEEFCGLRVSDNTIRGICQAEASGMAGWQRESPDARQPFRQADGDIEFSTDGTSVNTTKGWREMRIGIFSKRERGEPASIDNWDTRDLPRPHVRVAFAAIEKSKRFGSRWGRWATRLGIRDTSKMTVLGDGARWIWEESSMHFAGASGVLDVFHAIEKVAGTAKGIYDQDAATTWTDAGRDALLTGGWPSIRRQIDDAREAAEASTQKEQLLGLRNYLAKHSTHLDFPTRLADGRSIGSGQVEGACKNLIGRRLKQTGARWAFRRVNRMGVLCCLVYSDHWKSYWNAT